MSSMVVEKTVFLKADPENCMTAFKDAISSMDKYSIRSENMAAYTVQVDKKAAFRTGGYGENVTFVVKPAYKGCDILLSVSPKGLPYLLWQKNCEKVAQDVLNCFLEKVEKYICNDVEDNNSSLNVNVADEIKKFKELLDLGAITQEEFDMQKKKLLGL